VSSCQHLEDKASAGSLSDGQHDLLDVEADYRELRHALALHVSALDRQRVP
jgi:hypothetical protein